MQAEVLGNIPRLYTALADWLACLLYLFFLPKRTAGWRRYTIHAVFLLLLGVFMQATGQVPQFWFLPCIAVSILIMYLYIRMQTDVPARCAGYYCVRAFILGELAASLEWQLYYYMAGQQGTPGTGVRVCILAVVYAAVYGVVFALERNYNDIASPLHVHKKEFLSTLFIGVAVYAASNLSYVSPDTPFSGKMTAEIYNIRTLVDLGGMAILFAHHMQLVEYRRKKERDALQNVLQAQYAQYRSAQDSIDLINKKYHDLKHQIAVLRSETSEEKAHYLDAMEQEIRSYEAQNKTGNEVLDTILTSKSLYCQQHGITLTCVADGAALDFMDTMDLCSLFGNALDNAIESVEKLPDSEQRLIHLVVARKKSFVWIRVENTYDGTFQADGTLPKTTKTDARYHGYGLRYRRKIRRHRRDHHPGEPVHIKGAVSHQAEITRTAHFGGLFFALSNLHIKRMIRLSISPMPQAACAGKTTVHVVNPLFAVHCDIVQTTEKESLLRFLLWITLKARILYESNIPSHRLDVPPSGRYRTRQNGDPAP